MRQGKIFVGKADATVYTVTAGAVKLDKVPALNQESRNDAVEKSVLVAHRPIHPRVQHLASAEGAEIFSCSGHSMGQQLYSYAALMFYASRPVEGSDSNIQEDHWIGFILHVLKPRRRPGVRVALHAPEKRFALAHFAFSKVACLPLLPDGLEPSHVAGYQRVSGLFKLSILVQWHLQLELLKQRVLHVLMHAAGVALAIRARR
mmetsp:Transcript_97695/g.142970  ORF Transcript_97695/g.142970 Transcript_97695/m.142970 type:complete len:204 (+) Transcript_97695:348-959(+)